MIDKFGQIMLYVNDVEASASFWIEKLNFKEVDRLDFMGKLISVELSPYEDCDVNLVLFDKPFVAETSPSVNPATPSLLFSTYDIKKTNEELKAKGVAVSEISEFGGLVNFNFPDNENNYFAFREIKK